MKTLILAAALTAGLATAAAPVLAQPINARENNQQQRIDQGVRSGALTPREAAHDERGLARTENKVSRERAGHGGVLTSREHRRMEARMNRQSHHIYRTKHNNRVG